MYHWKAEKRERLLSFVKEKLGSIAPRTSIRWAIEHNRCQVNGVVERFCSYKVEKGDEVKIWLEKNRPLLLEKERILFEDPFLLFYDKPPAIPSEHLAEQGSLFLVHRLDRDTTGVILFAKDKSTQSALEQLFRDREIEKQYLGLVEGLCPEKGIFSAAMRVAHRREGAVHWEVTSDNQGVWSQTRWECLGLGKKSSFISFYPLTGRTHQIRVHAAAIGHPLIGDRDYGSGKIPEGLFRPLLHARSISLIHPETNKKLIIEAPLPVDFIYWRGKLIEA